MLENDEFPNQFSHVKRWRRFDTSSFLQKAREQVDAAKKAGKIKITALPCACKCNHYSIEISGDVVCPVRFWLGAAALMETERTADEFVKGHKFGHIVKRIDTEKDAVYRPHLDWSKIESKIECPA